MLFIARKFITKQQTKFNQVKNLTESKRDLGLADSNVSSPVPACFPSNNDKTGDINDEERCEERNGAESISAP